MSNIVKSKLAECHVLHSYEPLQRLQRNGYVFDDSEWALIWAGLPKWPGRKANTKGTQESKAAKHAFLKRYTKERNARKREGVKVKTACDEARNIALAEFPEIHSNVADAIIRGGRARIDR